MKKFSIKCFVVGLCLGMAGVTAVFASGGIKSAEFIPSKVYFFDQEVPLENKLVSVIKDGETDPLIYMPMNEFLEYMNFVVEWNESNGSVNLTMKMGGNVNVNPPIANTNQNENTNVIPYDSYSKEAETRAIAIMENSGVWGREMDRLIPQMSPEVVDKVVFLYLDKQLFPGITPAKAAKTTASKIEEAVKYMSEEGRQTAEERLAAFY